MFCDPFLNTNISLDVNNNVLDKLQECGFTGEQFYGTGYSSADTKTPEFISETYKTFFEQIASDVYHCRMNLKRIWININPFGAYQPRHTHSEYAVAGTYYLKVPPDSGNIVFYHPSPHVETLQRLKPFYSFTHTHVPMVNDILLWPGYMSHEVTYNFSKQTRITISFCLDP